MRFPVLLAWPFLSVAPCPTLATSTSAQAQEGAGDEATLDAHARDLERRLTVAQKTGAMPRAEAGRHRRALRTMVRSAKADLLRWPHVITAAENATYRRTIAGVEAALARRSSHRLAVDTLGDAAVPADRLCAVVDTSLRVPRSGQCPPRDEASEHRPK